jgi:hypothetical protein
VSSGPNGFWSYCHADDTAEAGRIRRLAADIAAEYALLTGDELELFLDRDDLLWGENWRDRVDRALAGITFLIPVVTPRYFASQECRRELITFAQRATALGVSELLLPIIYVPVDGLEGDSSDEAKAAVGRVQWEPWTDIRLADLGSAAYREGVNRLARRLVQITEAVSTRPAEPPDESGLGVSGHTPPAPAGDGDSVSPGDDELGVIDKIAAAEAALPVWNETIEGMTAAMEEIAVLTTQAVGDMQASDARGEGFAGRLRVANRLAQELGVPADRLLKLSSEYASRLLEVDTGFSVLIAMLANEEPDDPDEDALRSEFYSNVREMASNSRRNADELGAFLDTLEGTAGFSRELRRPIHTIRDALHRVRDGQGVIDSWVDAIDHSAAASEN